MIRPLYDALLHTFQSAHKNDLPRCSRQLSLVDPRVGIGDSRAMSNIDTIHRGFVQAIRWLAPASCVLCRHLHNRARAICLDCEAAFSRNQHACQRCALPLQPLHSRVIDGFAPARISAPRLCPTCIKLHLTFLAHTRPTSCAPACETSYTCGSFRIGRN